MRICYRIAALRRQVKRLAAIAKGRAAQGETVCEAASFRPLAEAEVVVGDELLGKLVRLGGPPGV